LDVITIAKHPKIIKGRAKGRAKILITTSIMRLAIKCDAGISLISTQLLCDWAIATSII
jgi:hypothetical protein